MAPTKKDMQSIEIAPLERETAEFYLVGQTPLIFNRMAEKAKRELLKPAGRKTAAQKKTTQKHDPFSEFDASIYRLDEPDEPTLLAMPAPAFKKAMSNAGVDIPGATKAGLGRLLRVHGYRVGIYGLPQIFTTAVRSADAGKTPDMRTRAIVPEWACMITISYVTPLLTLGGISNVLSGAGEIIGIGDFRQEKGAGDFGLFRIASADDKEYVRIAKQGREAQERAMKSPDFFDAETEELLTWFQQEIEKA